MIEKGKADSVLSPFALLLAFLELARWHSALGAGVAVWVGGRIAGGTWSAIWLHPIAIAILLSAAGNSYNDAQDVTADRINRPNRPIPRGAITPEQAQRFALGCGTLALLLALPLGIPTILGTIAGITLLYLYTPHLKAIPLVGNGVVGLLVGMSVGFGGLMAGNVPSVVLPAIAIGLLFGGRELLKTLYDVAGDHTTGVSTVATQWGERATLRIAIFIFILAIVVWVIWATIHPRWWVVPLAGFIMAATTIIPLWLYPQEQRVRGWALGWSKGLGLLLLLLLAIA